MPPHIHNAEIHQDSKTILFQGSKQEAQHNPCWSYRSQDLRPTKIVGIKMHIPPPKCNLFNDYVGQAALASDSMTTTS